jgi:hypothetical protein
MCWNTSSGQLSIKYSIHRLTCLCLQQFRGTEVAIAMYKSCDQHSHCADPTLLLPPITTKTTSNSVSYAQQQLGVSLSEGLKKAYDECKAKVERIAAQCRAKNRKFR